MNRVIRRLGADRSISQRYTWIRDRDLFVCLGLQVKEPECRYFPTPTMLSAIKTEVVTQVHSRKMQWNTERNSD